MTTNPNEPERLLDAAAKTIITERCQRAYLHDMRGGLQAIAGAFELLAKLARNRESSPALVETASAMAKRALANHESALLEMVQQMTSEDDSAVRVELGALIDDILRFLRNDIACKQIDVNFSHAGDCTVQVQKHKLRLVLLGLIALRIDDCPQGSELVMRLDRADACARLELSSPVLPSPPRESRSYEPRELVLDMARQWLSAQGGRLEASGNSPGRCDLTIYYPMLS
jgi:signal transduction histidine kinase